MSFQKQTTSEKETPGYTPAEGGIVSLINLAANLKDSLYRRAIGKMSTILEELKSITPHVHSNFLAAEHCVVTSSEPCSQLENKALLRFPRKGRLKLRDANEPEPKSTPAELLSERHRNWQRNALPLSLRERVRAGKSPIRFDHL